MKFTVNFAHQRGLFESRREAVGADNTRIPTKYILGSSAQLAVSRRNRAGFELLCGNDTIFVDQLVERGGARK